MQNSALRITNKINYRLAFPSLYAKKPIKRDTSCLKQNRSGKIIIPLFHPHSQLIMITIMKQRKNIYMQ